MYININGHFMLLYKWWLNMISIDTSPSHGYLNGKLICKCGMFQQAMRVITREPSGIYICS